MKRVLGYYKTRNLSGSLPVKMPKSPFRLYISQIRGTMTTFLGRHSDGGLKMGGALSDANSHQVGMVATRRFTLHPCSWLRSRTEQNVHGWEPEYWGGSAGSG